MSGERQRILANGAANAVHMVAAVAVTLIVSPILVRGLGDTRYGLWMFVNSIVAYMTLGNLGVGQAVIRYIAKYDALDDLDRMNRVFNTATAFFACVGLIICGVGVGMAWLWKQPAGATPETAHEMRWLLALMGCTLGTGMMLVAGKGVLVGLRQYPVLRTITIASLVLRNVLLVAVVWWGGGLALVGGVIFAVSIADSFCAMAVARRYAPSLRFSARSVDWETGRALGSYGIHVFVGMLAGIVVAQSALVIIGAFVGAEGVTYYSIASLLPGQAVTAIAAVVVVLTPSVSHWEAVADHTAIRKLFLMATRYTLYVAVPIELGLLLFGAPFLALWMGRQYVTASYMALVASSAPLFLAVSQLTAARILEGIGKVRVLAAIGIVQAVLTVGLGVALVRPLGVEGVAWGVSGALGLAALAIIGVTCHRLEVSPWHLLRRSFGRPFAASAVAAVLWLVAMKWIAPDTWGTLIGLGLIGLVPYALVVAALEPALRRLAVGTLISAVRITFSPSGETTQTGVTSGVALCADDEMPLGVVEPE